MSIEGARRFRLRSWLFIPGDRPERFEKALTSGADVVIFDLEDAVQDARVEVARAALAEALAAPSEGAALRFVRVRAFAPYPALHADLDAVVRPGLDGVVLPKLEDPADLARVDAALDVWEATRGLAPGSLLIAGLVEHPRAVLSATALAAASPRLAAFLFGAEDYATETGLEASAESPGLTHARAVLAMSAQAADIPAIDMVERDFKDLGRVEVSAVQGRALGYAGKLAIHPAQVPPINAGFGSSPTEVEHARQIVGAWDAAPPGSGAISVDGEMVDLPVVERARRILAAGAAGKRDS